MSASRRDREMHFDWISRGLPVKNSTPAVLLYYNDLLADTSHMTDAEFGQYVRLLCAQNKYGHMKPEKMNRMVGTKEVLPEVMEQFDRDEEGCYFNERMEVEIVRRLKNQKRLLDNLNGRADRQDLTENEQADQ